MVPMHLGLKNRLFVPHNLTPVQESPAPSLKFQMMPRLKLLMSSGSRKRSPDILVCMKPKLNTHIECEPRFYPLLHTSNISDYWLAPLSEDVFSGYCVQ